MWSQVRINSNPVAVNRDAVLAALKVDMGAYRLNNFCETFNMPSVHPSTFVKKAKQFYALNEDAGRKIFDNAVELVKEQHRFMNHRSTDLDDNGRIFGQEQERNPWTLLFLLMDLG